MHVRVHVVSSCSKTKPPVSLVNGSCVLVPTGDFLRPSADGDQPRSGAPGWNWRKPQHASVVLERLEMVGRWVGHQQVDVALSTNLTGVKGHQTDG